MVAATPTRTSTITACADMMDKSGQYVYYGDSMHLGDNTMTLTVTPPSGGSGKETVYTFHVKVLPSLGSVSFSDSGTELAGDIPTPLTFAYSIKAPDYLTGLTPHRHHHPERGRNGDRTAPRWRTGRSRWTS